MPYYSYRMRTILLSAAFLFYSVDLISQDFGVNLSITEEKDTTGVLIFKVLNDSNQSIYSGSFNKSLSNRVIIKDEHDHVVSYFFTGDINFDQIEVSPKSSLFWTYDMKAFFYPNSEFPSRLQNKKGVYKVIWLFNNSESLPFYYEYY